MKQLLIVLLILTCLALSVTAWMFFPVRTDGATFVVEPGATASHIADSLYNAGLIRHPLAFRLWVKASGEENSLGRGVYHFEGAMTPLELARQMRSGLSTAEQKRVTIPEGLRLEQTIAHLTGQAVGDSAAFTGLLSDTSFIRQLTPDSLFGAELDELKTLEGLLYPETYYVDADSPTPERDILRRMAALFFDTVEGLRPAEDSPVQGYGVLILASIIEKEALVEEEKPIIASVFLNRMRIGMALQSCPTVLYALAETGVYRNRLLFEDLDIQSPFNTYIHPGLPPAPICSPSLSSILAVLQPTDTKYLYFVADGHGRHRFSRTFDEHRRQRRKVQNGS